MTLRVDLSIVPYGVEKNKYEIYRLNISNIETIRNEGFGHEICRYRVDLLGKIVPMFRKKFKITWEHIDTDFIEEHDRRDGAVALVAKACKLMEERA